MAEYMNVLQSMQYICRYDRVAIHIRNIGCNTSTAIAEYIVHVPSIQYNYRYRTLAYMYQVYNTSTAMLD